ncbi:unnamed protein product [Rhodiola kirilowii]
MDLERFSRQTVLIWRYSVGLLIDMLRKITAGDRFVRGGACRLAWPLAWDTAGQESVAVMTEPFPDTSGKHAELVLLQNIGILCIGFLKRARQNKEVSYLCSTYRVLFNGTRYVRCSHSIL